MQRGGDAMIAAIPQGRRARENVQATWGVGVGGWRGDGFGGLPHCLAGHGLAWASGQRPGVGSTHTHTLAVL